MSNRPNIEIQRQTAFGDNGHLELTQRSVETSLDFGADVDHRERTSRMDRPEASESHVDDRPELNQFSESDQAMLFADTDDNQQTLTGEDAATRCLFGD